LEFESGHEEIAWVSRWRCRNRFNGRAPYTISLRLICSLATPDLEQGMFFLPIDQPFFLSLLDNTIKVYTLVER
jgi:hypothetical protein